MSEKLPVAVIGAGPVGLAAAAHLALLNEPFLILEQGPRPGYAIEHWAHVRTFTPWRFNVDSASRSLLYQIGWQAPDESHVPTGRELLSDYLVPLSNHPTVASRLRLNAKVAQVSRKSVDKTGSAGRNLRPFELRLIDGTRIDARAVIDASGTWFNPNPMGADGNFVSGERENSTRIVYGIPDVLGRDRARFSGKSVLVVGAGHSAINAVLDLVALRELDRGIRIQWAMRRENLASIYGGAGQDVLPARGALGSAAQQAIESGKVELYSPFHISGLSTGGDDLRVSGELNGCHFCTVVDEIVVATGFRPDIAPLREIRISLDPVLEASASVAQLIDPEKNNCGTVPPHGHSALQHPEKDFYVVGMKSYGRAPTFLMATGYEQVRSVVAALTGDFAAADRTELSLPQTGVFISDPIIRSAHNTPQSDHARFSNPQFTEGMS